MLGTSSNHHPLLHQAHLHTPASVYANQKGAWLPLIWAVFQVLSMGIKSLLRFWRGRLHMLHRTQASQHDNYSSHTAQAHVRPFECRQLC